MSALLLVCRLSVWHSSLLRSWVPCAEMHSLVSMSGVFNVFHDCDSYSHRKQQDQAHGYNAQDLPTTLSDSHKRVASLTPRRFMPRLLRTRSSHDVRLLLDFLLHSTCNIFFLPKIQPITKNSFIDSWMTLSTDLFNLDFHQFRSSIAELERVTPLWIPSIHWFVFQGCEYNDTNTTR